MIERVIYTEEADDDVGESYDWYESREPGLGEDFLRCVEQGRSRLAGCSEFKTGGELRMAQSESGRSA